MLTVNSLRRPEPTPDDSDEERPRRRWTIVAAAVLGLILLAGIVLAVLPPAGRKETSPQPAPSASPTSPETAAEGSASVCGLPPGDQSVPSLAPVSTDWQLVGTIATPTAPRTFGPGEVDGGVRSCFARSPLGTLYAATNFVASTSDPGIRVDAVRELTADGEGRDRALDLIEDADPGSGDSGAQIAGFTFLNWDQSYSTVDIALNYEGTAVHVPIPLRWEDGDWKVVLPADGDLFGNLAPLPNLTGYVPWSGA